MVVLFTYLALGLAWAYPETPQPNTTPGHLCSTSDAHFKEFRYQEQIPYCRRRVSSGLKRRIYQDYGVPISQKSQYTIDHLIPLSIGGSNRTANLWPEHHEIKALRPDLEFQVFVALRDGRVSQRRAIQIILDAKFNPYDRFIEIEPLPLGIEFGGFDLGWLN